MNRAKAIRAIEAMKRRLAPIFARIGLVLVLLAPRSALANTAASGNQPSDTVMVLQPSQIVLPPVPQGFETRDLGWMRAVYPRAASERVRPALDAADAFKEELARRFGQAVLDHVDVRIARDPDEMARLAPAGMPPPRYASGVAYPSLHLILITLIEPRSFQGTNVLLTLEHELVHVAVEDAFQGKHVPRWFNEGIAIHESGEQAMDRWQVLSSASLSGTLIPLDELDRRFPDDTVGVSLAYAESADFVRFLMRDADSARFAALVLRVRQGEPFDQALAQAYGTSARTLEYQWHEDVRRTHAFFPAMAFGSALWVMVIVALGWGYVKRRRRAKATLARWAREEAEEDAIALAAARGTFEGDIPVLVPVVKQVEHEGVFHTLH